MKRYTQWYEPSLRAIPGGGFTLSTVHYGSHEYLYEAYDFLNGWMEKNGYRIKHPDASGAGGRVREIYLIDGRDTKKMEEYQTRLEVDIEKV